MSTPYDIIVIGAGPGGYVAAIRASQLGLKTALVEREALGGVCLNWGCIPTKALLKSASLYEQVQHAADYGLTVGSAKADFGAIIQRSRTLATDMSKGIAFLMKKNRIEVLKGTARLVAKDRVEVCCDKGTKKEHLAKHIVLATGAKSRELAVLTQDGKQVIGYREAMTLPKQPKRLLVVGSGAIGTEFAYFYHALGTKVVLVEALEHMLPQEDSEVSAYMKRHFSKSGMEIHTGLTLKELKRTGKQALVAHLSDNSGATKNIEADVVLSAVGISRNVADMGLEALGVQLEGDSVGVDDYYGTSQAGIYAIGDLVKGPALAHVASAEGIICIEKIAGMNPEPLNYKNIPSCTYCQPEVASVGYTEAEAKEAGYELKVGTFPFSASGKAKAAGATAGFVKVVYDAKYGELLGGHIVGEKATEMIAELVVARKLETTGHEILKAVHPHPTYSEAIMEATAAAYGEVIHL